jgi:hypothetical protein
MQPSSNPPIARRLRAAVAVAAIGYVAVGTAAPPVSGSSAAPGYQPPVGVEVSFDSDCVSAVVTSLAPSVDLVIVFDDESVDRIDEIPRAASYILRLAPRAVAAGLSIADLFVLAGGHHAGASSGQPSGKGVWEFACTPGAAAPPQ